MNPFPLDSRQPALVAITRRGAAQAARLARLWPDAALFLLPPWHESWPERATPLPPPLRDHIPQLLAQHQPVVFFCALGAVVRLIAPHLRNKRQDPAVLLVDEAARFVIPVVSGHLGGANQQALRLARLLQAMPVITTASDSQQSMAVDLLGQPLGWRLHATPQALIRVAAAVVNSEPVAWVQECGSQRWRLAYPQLPACVCPLATIREADPNRFQALLWITDHPDPDPIEQQWPDRLIRYQPPRHPGPSLWLGLGCDRHTTLTTLLEALQEAQAALRFSWEQVVALATIERKGDEAGLLQLAERFALPLTLFTAEQLAAVAVANPSAMVQRHVGTPSVSEASALLAAGEGTHLWLPKYRYRGQDGKNVTLAIARQIHPPAHAPENEHGW
ncbi:MAG: cobalamin biosynthesis protein [Magnetococcales bacterium]|nr:cobalamin biosynthesis protein [Magnetococcales bacterium]